MSAAGAAGTIVDGVRMGPPPDLPSMMLNNRIVYLGLPLASSVTELVVAELLYLNFDSSNDPIFMYINSAGTSSMPRQISGFETEAFAVMDTMNYIKPDVDTICLGTAFGTAAMLLANGKKGSRASLPNSIMMLHQPRSMARGQASDIRIKAREVLQNRLVINTVLAEKTGQTIEKVTQDSSRTMYLDANQALEYGLIDKVLRNEDDLPAKPSFLTSL
jgi:ATP-dependent Clp protease protease subunit